MSPSVFFAFNSLIRRLTTQKINRKVCGLFLCLIGANVQFLMATEITTAPIYTYVNGNNKASLIASIISRHNAAADVRRSNCFAGVSYQCNTHIITSYWPNSSAVTYNGIPNVYDIQTEQTSYWKDANGQFQSSTITPIAVQSIYLEISCPSSFELVTGTDPATRIAYCRKVEQRSCPLEGNPINVGTADKFEYEVDYSTADGLLKVERHYVDQRTGWMVDLPQKIVEVNAGATVPAGLAYSYTTKYKKYSLDAGDPLSLKEYSHVHYLQYYNARQQTAVYMNQGREHYLYLETASGFVGEGSLAQKTHLSRIDPASSQGAVWRLIRANGDTSYFGPDGSLQRTEFGTGGSLFYVYDSGRMISKTDHGGRQITYAYDNHGRISTVTLPDAQEITYEYDQDEESLHFMQIKKVIWPNGENISYLYNEQEYVAVGADAKKMLTGKLDSQGNRIGIYKYNSSNKAISTEGALGVLKREMLHSHYNTQVTNGLGSQTVYNFGQTRTDGTRLVTSTSQPAGSGCAASSESITYYVDGLKRVETNFNGHKTQFAYDHARGLETVRVEGVLKTDYKDYLPQGTALGAGARKISTQWHSTQRHKIKTAEPKLITYFIYNGDLDPFDNRVAVCAPTDLVVLCRKVQQATTDSNGALGFSATLDTTLANREWLYTYNERGQVLMSRRSPTLAPDYSIEYYDTTTSDWTKGDRKKITNALGHITYFDRYDPNGRLLKMTDANGVETLLSYDMRGRLTSQSLNDETTSHTYDLNGNRIGSVLPNGVAITYHYDAAKRLTAIENAVGDQISYEYDVENNLRFERISNTSGELTYMKEHVYDALSRVQNTIDSENYSTTYLYDAMGNLTGEQDAKQQTTNHVFDALNQPQQTTDALNGKTEYGYDNRGNLTQVKDPKGLITTYSYNAFGDMIQQVSPDTNTTTFTYDNAGNRTSATDSRGVVVNYTYDALNRLTQVQYPASPAENVTYEYDARTTSNRGIGKLTRISKTGFAMSYLYNHQGLVTQKNTNVDGIIRAVKYAYDRAGQLTSITYPSGRIVSYSYNSAGRIVSVKTKVGSGTVTTLVGNINYLPFGPATRYTYGNGLNLTQHYDQDYRLNAIDVGGSKAIVDRDYTYDPVNNITGITNHLDTNKSQSYDYDPLNRLTAATGVYGLLGYTYDAVGNRLSEHHDDGGQVRTDTYTYPSNRHRLASITRRTTNQPNSTRNFTYDAAGNRIAGKTEDGKTQSYSYNKANRLSSVSVNNVAAASYVYNPLGQRVSKTVGSTNELYFYDEAGQLLTVTNNGGTTLREYIYLDSQQVAFISNGSTYYIHNDHLDTPQVVTDQNQQVVWMGDYQPFGKLAETQTNSIELYSRFPGQYLDSETGLYYNYFRDYDPSVGRYIQSDPIGLTGGINTYAYVEGNPVSKQDPLGLRTVQCTKPLNAVTSAFGSGTASFAHSYVPYGYHQYSCVIDGVTGAVTCGGQDRGENGQGKPSNDVLDPPGGSCTETQPNNQCFEICMKDEWRKPRPNYGIIPFGTDCQDYDDALNDKCKKQCNIK